MLAIACSIALSACGSSGGGTPSAQPAPTPQQPGNNSGSGGGGDSKQTEDAKKAEEAKKAEADRKKNEAIATGKPVVSHYVPNYTPHANSYPWGQCTWGAKVLAPWAGDYWGNGGQWAASAAAAGFKTGNAPVAGALISWNDGGYGHIAFVTDVREDGMIQVLEANYGGSAYAANPAGIQNYRGWFNPSSGGSYTYIYPKN